MQGHPERGERRGAVVSTCMQVQVIRCNQRTCTRSERPKHASRAACCSLARRMQSAAALGNCHVAGWAASAVSSAVQPCARASREFVKCFVASSRNEGDP